MAMESSSWLRDAAPAQLSSSSSSNSEILGPSSSAASGSHCGGSNLSATKLRSVVAWARLEASRHRGCAGDEGSSDRLDALDSLAMRFNCDIERIAGVQGTCTLRPRARDGRPGSWSTVGNEIGVAVDASAGRGIWHTVRYFRALPTSFLSIKNFLSSNIFCCDACCYIAGD